MLKFLLSPFFAAADARAELEIVTADRDALKQRLSDLRQTIEGELATADHANRILRAAIEDAKRREQDTSRWIYRRFYGDEDDVCAAGTADENGVPMAEETGTVLMFPGNKTVN